MIQLNYFHENWILIYTTQVTIFTWCLLCISVFFLFLWSFFVVICFVRVFCFDFYWFLNRNVVFLTGLETEKLKCMVLSGGKQSNLCLQDGTWTVLPSKRKWHCSQHSKLEGTSSHRHFFLVLFVYRDGGWWFNAF